MPRSGGRPYASREHMNGSVWGAVRDMRGGDDPVTKTMNLTSWTVGCPRPVVLPLSGIGFGAFAGAAASPAPLPLTERVRYASAEIGRERSVGVDLRVEPHVLAMPTAIQMNAQVKGASKRILLGPHPWRPPEH